MQAVFLPFFAVSRRSGNQHPAAVPHGNGSGRSAERPDPLTQLIGWTLNPQPGPARSLADERPQLGHVGFRPADMQQEAIRMTVVAQEFRKTIHTAVVQGSFLAVWI